MFWLLALLSNSGSIIEMDVLTLEPRAGWPGYKQEAALAQVICALSTWASALHNIVHLKNIHFLNALCTRTQYLPLYPAYIYMYINMQTETTIKNIYAYNTFTCADMHRICECWSHHVNEVCAELAQGSVGSEQLLCCLRLCCWTR